MLNREISIRKPNWLKLKIPTGEEYKEISRNLKSKGLHTVCEEAKCPNLGECWEAKTATIMILGDVCTRACKFCNVKTGNPEGFINFDEIANASKMVEVMGLQYVVVTSVDRDDIPDFGASHFANVVTQIKKDHPTTKVEVLIPDFNVVKEHMHTLAESGPFVIAQNIETVKRLTHPVRDRRAGYEKTMQALNFYRKSYPQIATKSSLMVGLGESIGEIKETLYDLKENGVRIITFGQYLQPSRQHLAVEKFYSLEEFSMLKELALNIGFDFVASGPMVRSSYKAADYLKFLEENA